MKATQITVLAATLGSTAALGAVMVTSLRNGGNSEMALAAGGSETTVFVHDTVLARNIPLFSHEASGIIVGTIHAIGPARWSPDHATVEREVMVDVEEDLKGDFQSSQVVVAVEGGSVPGRTVLVGEGVGLEQGEHVLLFLGRNTRGEFVVFAGPVGKYLIDDAGVVTSVGEFSMSLTELENQIFDALEHDTPALGGQ